MARGSVARPSERDADAAEVRSPTRSSSRPARRSRMAGVDKLPRRSAVGRCSPGRSTPSPARPASSSIVVVTAADREAEVADAPWLPPPVVDVVTGGPRRQDSVRGGFRALEAASPDPTGERVVLVHDGARPLVSAALDRRRVAAAAASTAPRSRSCPWPRPLKRLDGDRVVETVDRSALGPAQTPQGVRAALLRRRCDRSPPRARRPWTDEAALLEACRIPVHVVPGDPSNLKVTVPADLARAADALGSGQPGAGRASATDSHPFGPGDAAAARWPELLRRAAPVTATPMATSPSMRVADALLGAAGARRPRAALPRGPRDAGRGRQHGDARRGRAPSGGGGLAARRRWT